MACRNTPVTTLTLLISSISTLVLYERYMEPRITANALHSSAYTGRSFFSLLLRSFPFHVIPLGVLGVSKTDIACAFYVLFRCRLLEQRWGSSYFLSFLCHASLLGAVALHMLLPPASLYADQLAAVLGDSSSSRHLLGIKFFRVLASVMGNGGEGLRTLCAAASIVPLAALTTRYMREIPALRRMVRLWGGDSGATSHAGGSDAAAAEDDGAYYFTEKSLIVVALAKLVVFPNTLLAEMDGNTKRRLMLHLTNTNARNAYYDTSNFVSSIDFSRLHVSLLLRLVLCLVGVFFGFASTRNKFISQSIGKFSKHVCRFLLNALAPFTSVVLFAGPTNTIEHVLPPHYQDNNNNNINAQRGDHHFNGNNNNHVDNIGGHRRNHEAAQGNVDMGAVQQIEELQLPGVSREAIIEALRLVQGDVNAAVQHLLAN